MILLDSNVLIAYANGGDTNHDSAVRVMRLAEEGTLGKAVVLDLVFSELMTVLALKIGNKPAALKFGEIIRSAYGVSFSDERLFSQAFEIFAKQHSKLSFADCALLAYSRFFGAQIATFDKDLAKAAGPKSIC